MRNLAKSAAIGGLAVLLSVPTLLPARTGAQLSPLEDKVRKAIVTLPYYGVFDDISFRVDGNTVTLLGEVTGPGFLKDDAGRAVQKVEGVSSVRNDIEVLPLSPFDDEIRARMYRALFRDPQLGKYSVGVVPALHIIVKNGNVTLTGVVLNQMDRTIANLRANTVSGVFSVTNDLQTEK